MGAECVIRHEEELSELPFPLKYLLLSSFPDTENVEELYCGFSREEIKAFLYSIRGQMSIKQIS